MIKPFGGDFQPISRSPDSACMQLRGRCRRRPTETETRMGRISLGISLGGIIVILGFVAMTFWSFWIGLIVTIIGLFLCIPTKNRRSKQPG
jgi:hypothetical protein